MAELRTKLEALVRIGRHLPAAPELSFLLGFLAGNLPRLYFVRTIEGAPVAITLSAGRRTLWPASTFEASVHQVPVPLPGAVVSALAENSEPICVRVLLDDAVDAAWLEPLLLDSYSDIASADEATSLEGRMRGLRARIDQQLDVYRECRRLLTEGAGEDEERLRFFLGLAETEIEGLGHQLGALNRDLEDRAGR